MFFTLGDSGSDIPARIPGSDGPEVEGPSGRLIELGSEMEGIDESNDIVLESSIKSSESGIGVTPYARLSLRS